MILDTRALFAYADGDGAAMARISSANRVAIPVMVLGEYRYGIAHSRHKTDYTRWLADFISDSSVLDVRETTADHYADI